MAHLVVTLLESLLRKTLPALRPVNRLRSIQRHVQITALDSQIEASIFVLHEMQSNLYNVSENRDVKLSISVAHLREALLLQVRDNALAEEVRRPDDVQHLLVVVAQQSQLEPVFRGVDRDGPGTG